MWNPRCSSQRGFVLSHAARFTVNGVIAAAVPVHSGPIHRAIDTGSVSRFAATKTSRLQHHLRSQPLECHWQCTNQSVAYLEDVAVWMSGTEPARVGLICQLPSSLKSAPSFRVTHRLNSIGHESNGRRPSNRSAPASSCNTALHWNSAAKLPGRGWICVTMSGTSAELPLRHPLSRPTQNAVPKTVQHRHWQDRHGLPDGAVEVAHRVTTFRVAIH